VNVKEWLKMKKNGSNSAFLTVFKPFCSAPAASQHVPAQPWPAKNKINH
jgi:hypothetical protein